MEIYDLPTLCKWEKMNKKSILLFIDNHFGFVEVLILLFCVIIPLIIIEEINITPKNKLNNVSIEKTFKTIHILEMHIRDQEIKIEEQEKIINELKNELIILKSHKEKNI